MKEIQSQPQELNHIPPNNKNKIIIVIASLLVITILFIMGYFVLSKYSVRLVGNQTQQLSKKIDTSDWKTYTDKQYHFEFKYPSYFFRPILTEDDEIVFQTNSSQDDGLIIKIFKRSEGFHLNEFFSNCTFDEQTKKWRVAKPDMVNYTNNCPRLHGEKDGVTWHQYTVSDEIKWREDVLIDSGEELLVNIAIQGSQVSKNTVNILSLILSTFKFAT